jgi:hypothetical protein
MVYTEGHSILCCSLAKNEQPESNHEETSEAKLRDTLQKSLALQKNLIVSSRQEQKSKPNQTKPQQQNQRQSEELFHIKGH